VASKLFRESLFGGSHPYGRILEKSDINKTTRELIVDFFTVHISNRPFTIFASGNFDDNVIQTIKSEFGNIDITGRENSVESDFSGNGEAIYIEKGNSVQTSLRLGSISIPKSHSDYRGLMVANEILGGYFGSRLMKNIREEKGLTYGIYSGIANLKHASYFVISADVKKENRLEAISEIIKEIEKLQNIPVSEEELNIVRNYMLGQLQSSINTPFALISHFKDLYQNGLSYDYFQKYIQTIRSITPTQIQSLVQKYMTPDKLVSVGVG
jgi:predicted Zn-dependent peptidase